MKAISAAVLVSLVGLSSQVQLRAYQKDNTESQYPKNLDEDTLMTIAFADQATDEARAQEIKEK